MLAEHLPVERHVHGGGEGAGAGRPQQGRVGTAHRVAVPVGERVGVDLVDLVLVVERAEELDPTVGRRPDARGVLQRVRRRADHDQGQLGRAGHVALDDLPDVVLRLEPRHDQVKPAGGQAELSKPIIGNAVKLGRAIRDAPTRHAELVDVVLLNAGRVGNQLIGPTNR